MGAGRNSYVGWIEEVAWGTPLAPTKFEELVAEDAKALRVREQRPTFRSLDMRKDAEYDTKDGAEGSFTIELNYREQLRLWEHLFGAVVDFQEEAGRESHTFTLTEALMAGQGLSIELGKDARAIRYQGCKLRSVRFAFDPINNGQAEIDFVAQDATGVAPATPTFPDVSRYVAGHQTVVEVDTVARTVDNVEITIDNALDDDKRVLGLKTIDEPIRGDAKRVISGTFTADGTAGDWDNFLANTDFQLEVNHIGAVLPTAKNYRWDLDLTACRILEDPLQVTSPGIVKATVNFEARIPAGGGAMATLIIENEDAVTE